MGDGGGISATRLESDRMSRVRAVAARELRAYFNSPIAYVFLTVFAGSALFAFFNVGGFFSRGVADPRGLFGPLPLLMILLVPALTMRLWAEEQKQGTLEVLLTLPVRDHQLVAGKFLASWILLACGLALTLALPFSVALIGKLDWGPVIGGYVGALLLGAAYLAVGQFVSATTENQILAFILALVVCLAFYGVGTEVISGLFDDRTAAALRGIGTGSRFQSVARGVIDLRDLVYYASVTLFFLAACVMAVRGRRWT